MLLGIKINGKEEVHVFQTRYEMDVWLCDDLLHNKTYDDTNEQHKKIFLSTIKNPARLIKHYIASDN